MAVEPGAQGSKDPNYPAHVRNYEGFLKLLKWSMLVTAIIGATTIYIIAN